MATHKNGTNVSGALAWVDGQQALDNEEEQTLLEHLNYWDVIQDDVNAGQVRKQATIAMNGLVGECEVNWCDLKEGVNCEVVLLDEPGEGHEGIDGAGVRLPEPTYVLASYEWEGMRYYLVYCPNGLPEGVVR